MKPWYLHTIIAASVPVLLVAVLPLSQIIEIMILSLAVAGCTFLYGQLGLMSFGQGVFYGLGSYAAGLASIHLGATPDLALLCAIGVAVLASLLIGALIVSRKGVYFALLTVAFSQLFAFLNHSLHRFTGGENGLVGVQRAGRLFGLAVDLSSTRTFFVFTLIVFVLAMASLFWVWASHFGRTLPAIRDNETRAQSLGLDTYRRKLLAFVIAGAVAGLAGGLHAMFSKFVPPSAIEFEMSERLMLMTILGGKGSLHGAWLGTGFMIIAADTLGQFWPRYLMLVGAMLIAVVLFMPTGLYSIVMLVFGKMKRGIGTRRLLGAEVRP